jgi:hypothetical protein
LKPKRFGVAALKAARVVSLSLTVKIESLPAASAPERSPVIRLTVLSCKSWAPVPVPLSV